MEKKNNFWFGFAMLLLGIIIGFFMAPMKKGVNVKNICGNQNWRPEENWDEEDWEEACDEDCCCECDEDNMPF